MSCSNCRGNGGCRSCGPSCSSKDSINWLMPVEKLPLPKNATRRYMYILPNDSLYILNYQGNDYVEISTVVPEVVEVRGVE